MDKKEFEQNFESIKQQITLTSSAANDVERQIKSIISYLNNFLADVKSRNENLINYIELLKGFDFADTNFSPIDLFPGIKTAKDMADPDELKKKSDDMKNAIYSVKNDQKNIEMLETSVPQAIRTLYQYIAVFKNYEAQVYDLSMDLLKKNDSIYDISMMDN